VTRTKSNAKLMKIDAEGSRDIASGTKPVNAKIEELFGYSSDVFRMANVCNQGKIEELGDMKPTARKQLIDETVGLNVLDELTDFIDEERKRLGTGIKAIESFLVAPVAPVEPVKVLKSSDVKELLDNNRVLQSRRNVIAAAAAVVLTAPTEVKLEHDDIFLKGYASSLQRKNDLMTEHSVLASQLIKIPKSPNTMVTELEPDDAMLPQYQETLRKLQELEAELKVNERGLKQYSWIEPLMSREEIQAYAARNVLVDRWDARQALIKKRVPHDCPKCQHHWDDEDPRIKTEYGDVPEARPDRQYTEGDLVNALDELQAKEAATPIIKRIEELKQQIEELNAEETQATVQRILTTRENFQKSEMERAYQKQREEITTRQAELMKEMSELQDDYSSRIIAINNARRLVDRYETSRGHYLVQLEAKRRAEVELIEFSNTLDSDTNYLDGLYVECLNYETNLANFNKAKQAYDKALGSLQELRNELVDWDNGRKAVVDLRAKVKGYLLPSLNSVSSTLLNQMTGGELAWIVMNDQGEVSVDGQTIETLSGAGKAVANLALRIGLGQVLTNRVFSVLMLDEIDAACDEDRAKYIAGCLMNLTKTIKQIIQVSHKQGLPADQYVRL
jgi:DNA repair exonuclease SbcCD ATPase subunit